MSEMEKTRGIKILGAGGATLQAEVSWSPYVPAGE